MMFMMPIPPTTREIPAIPASREVSRFEIWVKVESSCACVCTWKSSAPPCAAVSAARIAATAPSTASVSRAWATICPTVVTPAIWIASSVCR